MVDNYLYSGEELSESTVKYWCVFDEIGNHVRLSRIALWFHELEFQAFNLEIFYTLFEVLNCLNYFDTHCDCAGKVMYIYNTMSYSLSFVRLRT